MNKAIFILLLAVMTFSSCETSETPSDCESKICDQSFSYVMVSFTDKNGLGVPVKNYSAVNKRTGDTLKSATLASLSLVAGTYVIADDSHRKVLAENGDDIKISGTYEATNQTKTATVKIAGGKCACHIQKLSGPDKIAFD